MKLHFLDFEGRGRPIIILHGLFGSSKNWSSVGRFLSGFGRPYALDARNHGDSPHADSHQLDDLVGDLDGWLKRHGIERPVLLGHSMGGLTAMGYALSHPERVHALLVVDIAPRAYHHDFEAQLQALSLDLSRYDSRREIDRAMAEWVPDEEVRRFLQMNIERTTDGYRWKINTVALKGSDLLDGPDFSRYSGTYEGPALLAAGGDSPFVREEDLPLFRGFFPAARIEVIPDCGHWLHFVCSERFEALMRDFFQEQT